MKREPWLSSLLGIALGVCMAVGAMGCLTSAFELNIEYPRRLLLIWTAGSALCALLWRWRWGDLPVLLAVGLGMGYLLRRGELVEQLRQLIYRITYIYDQAYHWGLVSWPGMTWDGGAADLPVLVMGMLLAAVVCRSVCRGGSPAVSVMLAVLPLASCLVVTDTVPSWEGLFLLLFTAAVLLLTGTLRQEDPEQANRLTLMGAVPVAVRFILDDFATNCRIEEFPRMISSIRSRGISAMLMLQSEGQLKEGYGSDGRTIIGNCDTYVYLGGNDVETARAVAERCDLPLRSLLYMPVGECWIFRRGQEPVKAHTLDLDQYVKELQDLYEELR